MSWNYRVIEFVEPDGTPVFVIHEVHYDDAGVPVAYAENQAGVQTEGPNVVMSLMWTLDKMQEAVSKPVLRERDFHFDKAVVGTNDEYAEMKELNIKITEENVADVFAGRTTADPKGLSK